MTSFHAQHTISEESPLYSLAIPAVVPESSGQSAAALTADNGWRELRQERRRETGPVCATGMENRNDVASMEKKIVAKIHSNQSDRDLLLLRWTVRDLDLPHDFTSRRGTVTECLIRACVNISAVWREYGAASDATRAWKGVKISVTLRRNVSETEAIDMK